MTADNVRALRARTPIERVVVQIDGLFQDAVDEGKTGIEFEVPRNSARVAELAEHYRTRGFDVQVLPLPEPAPPCACGQHGSGMYPRFQLSWEQN